MVLYLFFFDFNFRSVQISPTVVGGRVVSGGGEVASVSHTIDRFLSSRAGGREAFFHAMHSMLN